MDWLVSTTPTNRRAVDEGQYLDENRYPYEELREKTYKEPYTPLSPDVFPPRGSEPEGECQVCGEPKLAPEDPCPRCKKDRLNTEPTIVGPSQIWKSDDVPDRNPLNTGFPADKTFVPTKQDPEGQDFAYWPAVTSDGY